MLIGIVLLIAEFIMLLKFIKSSSEGIAKDVICNGFVLVTLAMVSRIMF